MQVFRAPEGYQLDPASGLYYRETQIPGPDGQMVRHIVWFNTETGEYTQQSYYQPQPAPDPWADARHGGGGYSPEPPPPSPSPQPQKRPIFKRVVIPVVTVVCVAVVAVAGVKVLPPLLEKMGGNPPSATEQGGGKPSVGRLFGGAEQTKEGEIGNTMMNLQNGGLMACHNGWVYYADATKGGALYARKEGQSAEDAILVAPGQISNINVLGDELVYINSATDGSTHLAINGSTITYEYGRLDTIGGYCPTVYWTGDYNVGAITETSHTIQTYAGPAFKIMGIKQFEKNGSGLSTPVRIGSARQRYVDLTLTKDGVFAIKAEEGVPRENWRTCIYMKLDEDGETVLFEMPDAGGLYRACWAGGLLYLDVQDEAYGGSIYCYNPKNDSVTELGLGFSLTAWNDRLFCITGENQAIGEIRPGEMTISTVYSAGERLIMLVNNYDGCLGVMQSDSGQYLLLEQQGDTLELSKTVTVDGKTNPYLTSSTTFVLGDKSHTYFERYGDGIIPY